MAGENNENIDDEDINLEEENLDEDPDLDNPDDEDLGDLEDADPETLRKELIAERKRSQKRGEDYKAVEKQRNQMEALLGNIKEGLEESGVAKMHLVGDKVRIEVNKQGNQAADPGEAVSPEEAELAKLDKAEKDLKKQFKAAELDDADYFDKLADVKARKLLLQDKIESKKTNAQESIKQSQKTWMTKIATDFPEAKDQNSELFKEMSKLAKDGVDYMGDLGRYYELAERAKERLDARGPKKGKNMSATDEFETLSSDTRGGGTPPPKGGESILNSKDKQFIEVNIRGDAVKRVEKVLNRNVQMGTVKKDDKFLMNSMIFMES